MYKLIYTPIPNEGTIHRSDWQTYSCFEDFEFEEAISMIQDLILEDLEAQSLYAYTIIKESENE